MEVVLFRCYQTLELTSQFLVLLCSNACLLYSSFMPRAVNGSTMSPIGKLPLSLTLGPTEYTDEFHIFPQVKGALLSWKAAKGLKESYQHPPTPVILPCLSVVEHAPPPPPLPHPMRSWLRSHPVFDGQVMSMEGEEFHIELIDGAQPCLWREATG